MIIWIIYIHSVQLIDKYLTCSYLKDITMCAKYLCCFASTCALKNPIKLCCMTYYYITLIFCFWLHTLCVNTHVCIELWQLIYFTSFILPSLCMYGVLCQSPHHLLTTTTALKLVQSGWREECRCISGLRRNHQCKGILKCVLMASFLYFILQIHRDTCFCKII